jgi:hypothetical protein
MGREIEMKFRWLAILVLALPLAAQDEKKPENNPPPEPQERKLFILKYADPDRLKNLLGILGANASSSVTLHAVTVSASARDMPAIEDAIKRLDVPPTPPPTPPDIDLAAYFIIGSDAAPGSGVLPKELDPVVVQLKTAFPFKAYNLMDTLSLLTRSGDGGNTNSISQPEGTPAPVIDRFSISSATMNPDGSSVRVEKLRAEIRMPTGTPNNPQYFDLGLNADVDVKEGQKVVVGRLGIGRDQALFLVLTARVVH